MDDELAKRRDARLEKLGVDNGLIHDRGSEATPVENEPTGAILSDVRSRKDLPFYLSPWTRRVKNIAGKAVLHHVCIVSASRKLRKARFVEVEFQDAALMAMDADDRKASLAAAIVRACQRLGIVKQDAPVEAAAT